jgi:hypothetical protein
MHKSLKPLYTFLTSNAHAIMDVVKALFLLNDEKSHELNSAPSVPSAWLKSIEQLHASSYLGRSLGVIECQNDKRAT